MKPEPKLIDRLHLRKLIQSAGDAVDSIKINDISVGRRRGRTVRIKSRRASSERVAQVANVFFWMANANIKVLSVPKEWRRWEIDCFLLLNGDRYRAVTEGPMTVCIDEMPGTDLRKLVMEGRSRRRALEAAGVELRRAHGIWSKKLGGPWSHGDLTLANVIYDKTTDRARLIDFEVVHEKSLPSNTRQADDLLVLLQDMVGRVTAKQWLPFALRFLKGYARPAVIMRLKKLLVIPSGLPGVWWSHRCNHLDKKKLDRRLKALRVALDSIQRAQRENHKPTPHKTSRLRS